MQQHEGDVADSEMIHYQAEAGTQVKLLPVDGIVWLTQSQFAELCVDSSPLLVQGTTRVLVDEGLEDATINSELIVRTKATP